MLGVGVISAHKHSSWVISVHSISSACGVDRSRASSGSSAGAGKCGSRNAWHFSSGVTALCLFRFVMGSVGYFRAPVDQLQNWYVSVRGAFYLPKNCFFCFILRVNVLSAVWYSLSRSWGIDPYISICAFSLLPLLTSSCHAMH